MEHVLWFHEKSFSEWLILQTFRCFPFLIPFFRSNLWNQTIFNSTTRENVQNWNHSKMPQENPSNLSSWPRSWDWYQQKLRSKDKRKIIHNFILPLCANRPFIQSTCRKAKTISGSKHVFVRSWKKFLGNLKHVKILMNHPIEYSLMMIFHTRWSEYFLTNFITWQPTKFRW